MLTHEQQAQFAAFYAAYERLCILFNRKPDADVSKAWFRVLHEYPVEALDRAVDELGCAGGKWMPTSAEWAQAADRVLVASDEDRLRELDQGLALAHKALPPGPEEREAIERAREALITQAAAARMVPPEAVDALKAVPVKGPLPVHCARCGDQGQVFEAGLGPFDAGVVRDCECRHANPVVLERRAIRRRIARRLRRELQHA
jgi:hypothetical protein